MIDVRAGRPAAVNSFEALWSSLKKAERKSDLVNSQNTFREVRRLRIERNIRSLETLALARVADGVDALTANDADKASSRFADAAVLDPHLADPRFGLALAAMKKGPLGIVTAVRETIAGTSARLTSGRGACTSETPRRGRADALFVTVFVFALTMLLRTRDAAATTSRSPSAPGSVRPPSASRAAVLLLPAIAFQGWGWLPLWWLAVLSSICRHREGASVIALLATLAGGRS